MDKSPQEAEATTPAKQVMDVQPPQSSAPSSGIATPAPVFAESAVPAPDPTPTDTPPTPEPIAPPESDQAVVTEEAPVAPDQPSDQAPLVAHPAESEHHHKKPIVAVLVAVVVALGLAGVAIFAYQDLNKKKTADKAQTLPVTETETTPADVDDVTKEIDTNLNGTNDAADFDDNSLSDTNLNL